MTNIRMTSPLDGKHNTLTVNGRSYTCAAGSTIDVPDFDAAALEANNWLRLGPVGPTSARPVPLAGGLGLARGDEYIDTTLNAVIRYTGAGWVNTITGAAV